MIDAGVFIEDGRFELLDGEIVPKMSKNPPHSIVTRKLDRRLIRLTADGWHVRNQEPVTLSTSEPEPDLAVVRGTEDDYAGGHPQPADIALLIEVADNSVRQDRRKRRIYAAAAVREYWIVNIPAGVFERYTEPAGDRYAVEEIFHPGDAVPVTIDGTVVGTVPVAELLPGG